jgi:hypothetical protein
MKSELLIFIIDNIFAVSLFIFSIIIFFIFFDKYSNYNTEIKNNDNLKFNVSKAEITGSNINLLISIVIVSLFFLALFFIDKVESTSETVTDTGSLVKPPPLD